MFQFHLYSRKIATLFKQTLFSHEAFHARSAWFLKMGRVGRILRPRKEKGERRKESNDSVRGAAINPGPRMPRRETGAAATKIIARYCLDADTLFPALVDVIICRVRAPLSRRRNRDSVRSTAKPNFRTAGNAFLAFHRRRRDRFSNRTDGSDFPRGIYAERIHFRSACLQSTRFSRDLMVQWKFQFPVRCDVCELWIYVNKSINEL